MRKCRDSCRIRPGILVALAVLAIGTLAACDNSDKDTTTGSSEGDVPSFEVMGTWTGHPRQEGITPFEVIARIDDLDDPSQNTVHYAGSIDCSGNWRYLGREGKAYRFREVIDQGAGDSCKGVGVVTLTPFGANGVDYEIRGGGVESFGVLKRQGN